MSANLGQVCRRLGISPGKRTYEQLRRHIARLGIDSGHLPKVERAPRRRHSWTDVALHRPGLEPRSTLRARHSFADPARCDPREGLDLPAHVETAQATHRRGLKPNRCEMCGINEWNGVPLPLALDHINDNRLENLRIV